MTEASTTLLPSPVTGHLILRRRRFSFRRGQEGGLVTSTPKPRRKLPWYVIVLIAGLGLVVVACIAVVAIVQSELVTQAARGAADTLTDLMETQRALLGEYGLKPEELGVQISTQTFTSSSTGKVTTQKLNVTLLNTRFNALSAPEKTAALREIAAFADDAYPGSNPLDSVCVILAQRTQFLIFSSSTSQTSCFPARAR